MRVVVASALFALAGWGLAWAWWDALPPRVPIHWDFAGHPDDFASRGWAISLGPLVSLLLPPLVRVTLRLDPRRAHVAASRGPIDAVLIALAAFGFGLQVLTLRAATSPDQQLPVGGLLTLVGLLWCVLGVALPRTSSTWMFGIRTPWTLSDDRVWRSTHRLAGACFLGAGLLVVAAALLLDGGARAAVCLALLIGAPLPAGVHSYVCWRRLHPTTG